MSTADTGLSAWIAGLAERRPVPGGGGAGAVAAALGAAAGAMAARYTTGRRWADREAEARALADELETAASAFLALADEDAAAYAALAAARKDDALPTAERDRRAATALAVPLRLLEDCHRRTAALRGFLPACNPALASDCRVAIHLLAGAAASAWETLAVNDPEAATADRAREMIAEIRRWDAAALS